MKHGNMKYLKYLLILIVIFGITAGCSNETKKENGEKVNNEVIEKIDNSNSVVLYFSVTNNTEGVAKLISEVTNSDIIEIIPKNEYTSEDVSYDNDNCRANKEQNDDESRPEISNKLELDNYDTIYLGYPIWWGTNPRIILTLLDNYNLEGKTIIPFCTSGGSEIETSVNDLRKYNSKLNILDGKRFNNNVTKDEVRLWIEGNATLSINGKEYNVVFENNQTVNELLSYFPLTLSMSELNGNEYYEYLDFNLKTNSESVKKINAGDVMLYGDNCLVIFYKSFNTSYSYTKIGHINNIENLQEDLKEGKVIFK